MYRRDNLALVILYKTLLWITGGLGAIGFFVIIAFDDTNTIIGTSLKAYLLIIVFSLVVDFCLYKYFQNISSNKNISTKSLPESSESKNQDEPLWEEILNEFESEKRNKGLWAKCFAEMNGDETQAKAAYLKERFQTLKQYAADLKTNSNESTRIISNNSQSLKEDIIHKKHPSKYALNTMFGIVIILVAILIVGAIFYVGKRTTHDIPAIPKFSEERKSPWKERVNYLKNELASGNLKAIKASSSSAENIYEITTKPWNTYRKNLPKHQVLLVENTNTWWFERPNTLFIRLSNTTFEELLGVALEISSGSCSEQSNNISYVELNFEKSLLPTYDAVFKTELPFSYLEKYGKGTNCINVVAVFAK